MDAIAAEAGVAVQTVYFAFRTKPELLIAAYDQAVLGSLNAPTPDRQDWFLNVLAEQDTTHALQRLVDGVMGILVRSGPLHPVMISSPDEEVRRAFEDRQNGRYESYRQVVQTLIRRGWITPSLDEGNATDLLYALLSPELHSLLCTARGWSPDHFKTWMLATLETQLLRPQKPPPPAPAPVASAT